MQIKIEQLIKKIRHAEALMNDGAGFEDDRIPLGHCDGVDYHLVVTRKRDDFMVREMDEDALVESF